VLHCLAAPVLSTIEIDVHRVNAGSRTNQTNRALQKRCNSRPSSPAGLEPAPSSLRAFRAAAVVKPQQSPQFQAAVSVKQSQGAALAHVVDGQHRRRLAITRVWLGMHQQRAVCRPAAAAPRD